MPSPATVRPLLFCCVLLIVCAAVSSAQDSAFKVALTANGKEYTSAVIELTERGGGKRQYKLRQGNWYRMPVAAYNIRIVPEAVSFDPFEILAVSAEVLGPNEFVIFAADIATRKSSVRRQGLRWVTAEKKWQLLEGWSWRYLLNRESQNVADGKHRSDDEHLATRIACGYEFANNNPDNYDVKLREGYQRRSNGSIGAALGYELFGVPPPECPTLQSVRPTSAKPRSVQPSRTTMDAPRGCKGDECLRITVWNSPILSTDLPTEVLQHFRSHDGISQNWNRVAYTEWVAVGRADCDDRCYYLDKVGHGIQLSVDYGPEKGYKKLRIGLQIPSGCSNYQPFFEVEDAYDSFRRPIIGEHEIAYHDPHVHPIRFSRVHGHRVYGNVGSFIFQNEHSKNTRSVRMGALLTCQ